MEVGVQHKKVVFVIQARMQSTRMPGKVLMPIPFENGKPILLWIINQLKKSVHDFEIIVATSENSENDPIEKFCTSLNISCLRGSEENVLSRFITISKNYPSNCIVRLTGDNPVIDIQILDNLIDFHFHSKFDYTSTEGLPIGMNFEVISTKSFNKLIKVETSKIEQEHVTLVFKNNKLFNTCKFYPKLNQQFKNIRLTVDYPSDFALLSLIFEYHQIHTSPIGIELIQEVVLKYPWLFEINSKNFQIKFYNSLESELEDACLILEQFGLNRVSNKIKEKFIL